MGDFLNCHLCGAFVGAWGDCDMHRTGDYGGGPMEVGYPLCARCVRLGARADFAPVKMFHYHGSDVDPRYYGGPGVWMLQPDYELSWLQQRRQAT